jgi:mannose-6-phosphate isomerase-like protein (cupin superfamily)
LKDKNNLTKKDISGWIDPLSSESVDSTEFALNVFAKSQAILPPTALKNKILNNISQLNQKRKQQGPIDIANPPLLTEDSNLYDWMLATAHMNPPENFENIHLQPIKSDDSVQMFIAWVSDMVPEEVHHDLHESFMIIEGSCTCHITDEAGHTRIVHMQAGDYITMETGETHDIRITSTKPTKAVLQWLKLAA